LNKLKARVSTSKGFGKKKEQCTERKDPIKIPAALREEFEKHCAKKRGGKKPVPPAETTHKGMAPIGRREIVPLACHKV